MTEPIQGDSLQDGESVVHVEVAYSPAPRQVQLARLTLPAHACTVKDALLACGLADLAPVLPQLQEGSSVDLHLGIAGVAARLDTRLMDCERLDCCRPLRVDPKLARRERFNQQGVRRSGLFAKRRPGAVAGY